MDAAGSLRVLLVAAALMAVAGVVSAQTVVPVPIDWAAGQVGVEWSTVDGGGIDVMSGGGITVTGTAGQWDAGLLRNGPIVATGGYWAWIRTVTPGCPSDIDGNGAVGANDLTLLLTSFGTVAGGAGFLMEADVDDNGAIGANDLTLLLTSFGTSCNPL
ncbi:MAG: hypothetical protein IBJ11_03760 [Phycisphaerales bacterium]|nr:hypothetical protein [Phycisphaerales bacterium]